MPEDWTLLEVEATVADYFLMLSKELAGEPYNKAEHNRNLRKLVNRPKGGIEFKHQNISAILAELGWPFLDGYKPRSNYQGLLREVVLNRLEGDGKLQAVALNAVTAPAELPVSEYDWEKIHIPVPAREEVKYGPVKERPTPLARSGRKVNFLELEARNASLGKLGEEFILNVEHERLWRAGKRKLADRIEHVSQTQGDGLGFDIASFELDGRKRLIEVKTTRFGRWTPFFATRNEVDVSEENRDEYQLYRVFDFAKGPKLFVLPGSLSRSVNLEPMAFRASLQLCADSSSQ